MAATCLERSGTCDVDDDQRFVAIFAQLHRLAVLQRREVVDALGFSCVRPCRADMVRMPGTKLSSLCRAQVPRVSHSTYHACGSHAKRFCSLGSHPLAAAMLHYNMVLCQSLTFAEAYSSSRRRREGERIAS